MYLVGRALCLLALGDRRVDRVAATEDMHVSMCLVEEWEGRGTHLLMALAARRPYIWGQEDWMSSSQVGSCVPDSTWRDLMLTICEQHTGVSMYCAM